MRRKKRWTDTEVEKLRSMVGNHSLNQIAQELGRPRGSVSTKARELKMSLVFHRRRQKPASNDQPVSARQSGAVRRTATLFRSLVVWPIVLWRVRNRTAFRLHQP